MDIFIFKPDYILQVFPALLTYLPITLLIVFLSALFGLALGTLLAKGKLSHYRLPRMIAQGYTTVMRCTPGVVMMFVVYYGLPLLLIGLFQWNIQSLPNSVFAIIALSLLFAATSSELLRSAYLAVDKGQREAAVAMGLTEWQAFHRIIMPQCIKIIMPNLALSLVGQLKEASLAFTIGVIDLMGKAKLVISNNYNAMGLETYLAVALIYWMLSFLIKQMVRFTERRRYGRQLGHSA